jgi:hypothetical protein
VLRVLKTLQLEHVATIEKDIPRIHAAQPLFQSLIEQDLRLSINDGLDEVVRRGVFQAGTIVKGSEDILEVTRNPRYRPCRRLGAGSAQDPGHREDVHPHAGQLRAGPVGVDGQGVENSGTAVLDGDACGRLYVAPVELRAFRQDAIPAARRIT